MSADRLVAALAIALLALAALRRRWWAVPAIAALVAIAALLAARWWVSGHPPVFGTFEMDMAEALVLVAATLAVVRRAGLACAPAPLLLAALTVVHTFALRTEPTPLTISEQSLWIDVHAPLAWAAFALYLHGACLAFRPGPMQSLAMRLLGLGFLAHTAMGFIGVYYASLLFAEAWSWDPVQTLGLASWLLVAVVIHFRLSFRVSLWRQRYFLAFAVAVYVVGGKVLMLLPPGSSFHVFELGSLAPGSP